MNRATRDKRRFMADFETTVYEGQQHTEVWAAALTEINGDTEEVTIDHSIEDFFDRLISFDESIVVYFHNLKFDGEFIISYLLNVGGYTQALLYDEDRVTDYKDRRRLRDHEFITMISDRGAWYTITVRVGHRTIEFHDSLKLLPFSVSEIGKAFATRHKKLTMEYTGFRYAGCKITEEEKRYIANDVLVVREALEIMFREGHERLTIGSCCLDEFEKITGKWDYEWMFPKLEQIPIDPAVFEETDADLYIRRSYRGGWCYLAKGKANRMYYGGTTADVNSLYPSMMHSESGNRYPVGFPTFWKGNFIPNEATQKNRYFFIRIKTRFYLKPGKLPFIQIKNNVLYRPTECLERSDYYNRRTAKYQRFYTDRDGNIQDTRVTLTMTMTDYILFCEHYYAEDFEILSGCWFDTMIGIFDIYIDKYKKIKMESTGARRTLAKMFLNNLYGKTATGRTSSFKYAVTEDDVIKYRMVFQEEKSPGYIAVGSAITSYARNFTIRAAQANYHGVNEPGFIYADTDSIHCDLPADQIQGIRVDDNAFCAWKLEGSWDKAVFVRQKTYIEHITAENGKPVQPYHSIKCAGMPNRCKAFLNASFDDVIPEGDWSEEELLFMKEHRDYSDFKRGLLVPGKLVPKRMPGGIVLTPTTFEIRT